MNQHINQSIETDKQPKSLSNILSEQESVIGDIASLRNALGVAIQDSETELTWSLFDHMYEKIKLLKQINTDLYKIHSAQKQGATS